MVQDARPVFASPSVRLSAHADPFRYRTTVLNPYGRGPVQSSVVGSAWYAPIGKGRYGRRCLSTAPALATPVTKRPPRRSWPTRRSAMQRSVTYTVIITKHPRGFVATCPALADCVTLGRSRAGAYKAIKHLIRRRLTRLIEEHRPVPLDPVVSVKHLRINLLEIHWEVNLR